MAEGSLDVAVAIEQVFSVVATMLGGVFLLWWWLRREDSYLLWMAAWSFAAALTLALQAGILLVPQGSDWLALLVPTRTVALGALTAFVIPPVCLLAGRRPPWWLVGTMLGIYFLRLVLTVTTDLLWDRSSDDYGLPTYTPLRAAFMGTPLLVVIFLLPVVRRIPDGMQRKALYVAFALALLPVPMSVLDDPLVRELATGAWSLPIIGALALISLERVRSDERARQRLVLRQQSLLRLVGLEPGAQPAAAEQDLTDALGHPVTVTVVDEKRPGPPAGPDTGAGDGFTLTVRGHRSAATARAPGLTSPVADGDAGYVHAVLQVVATSADRSTAEQELVQAALYDVLTGLPNRVLLTDRLEHALDRTGRHGGMVAVLFCDLDGFKAVNDTLGHAAGDALLREVAAAMQSVARSSDTVARFGGDEFVVVAEDLTDQQDAARAAERMRAAVGQLVDPVTGGSVRMSVGLACAGAGEASATRLVRAADQAMYRAKAGEGERSGGVVLGELAPTPEHG